MKLPKIVCICGAKRNGKDTAADVLCKEFGYKKIRMAEQLKIIVKAVFDFDDTQIETDAKDVVDKKWGISPRRAMQFFGTEVMQYKIQELLPYIGRTYFVDRLVDKYLSTNHDTKYVVSDMRFLHEYEALKPYGVKTICVKRNETSDGHVSETEYTQIPIDFYVQNDSTLQAFKEKIRRLEIFNPII